MSSFLFHLLGFFRMEHGPGTSRALQQVTPIAIRKTVVAWMLEDSELHGVVGLSARTIQAFPSHFRGTRSANLIRAGRWWASRDRYFPENDNLLAPPMACTRASVARRSRILVKASPGRGPQRSEWVQWLYPLLLESFDIYRKSGVKFSSKLLGELSMSILLSPDSIYHAESRDPKDDKLLIGKITRSWIQQFMDVHNIVLLSQRGRLSLSNAKEIQIQKMVAYHLGLLHRGFQSGQFDENLMENVDETHFVINMDNGRSLGFRGDSTVKYADVVAGGESMTLVVRISGGRRSMIEAPMIIFTNSNRTYPIRGIDDNIPGVCYRTSPKAWIDTTLFPEYFLEPRAYQADLHHRTKLVWLDNCSGHNSTPRLEATLIEKHTVLKFLPPCCTDLCQPADTFVISKIKDAWTKRWEAKKTDMIRLEAWQDVPRADGTWSGKLKNPGKRFFLQLAADAIEDVNRQVDIDNMSFARKSMIRCGLALGIDGTWNVQQLFPHLQEIVAKYEQHFHSLEVPPPPMAP